MSGDRVSTSVASHLGSSINDREDREEKKKKSQIKPQRRDGVEEKRIKKGFVEEGGRTDRHSELAGRGGGKIFVPIGRRIRGERGCWNGRRRTTGIWKCLTD